MDYTEPLILWWSTNVILTTSVCVLVILYAIFHLSRSPDQCVLLMNVSDTEADREVQLS